MILLVLFWLNTASGQQLCRRCVYALASWKLNPPALREPSAPLSIPFEETFFGRTMNTNSA